MADDPVVGIVGRVSDAGDQCGAVARRRVRDRAGEPVPYGVVGIGDGRVRPRFQRQLALIVVGIIRDERMSQLYFL